MQKNLVLLIFLLLAISGFAQKKAVTETGEEVILYSNGTWKYLNAGDSAQHEIRTSAEKFTKPANAVFLLKSTRFNVGFWLDPKKWQFNKSTDISSAEEFEVKLKEKDCYAIIITEKIEVPLESLKEIALKNAHDAAPDTEIIREEYRMLNGLKILCLQMAGSIKGIKFMYYGYYYSSPNGTLQYLTYTSQNLFSTYEKEMLELLNGLTEIK